MDQTNCDAMLRALRPGSPHLKPMMSGPLLLPRHPWTLNLHIAIVLLHIRVHYSVEIECYKSQIGIRIPVRSLTGTDIISLPLEVTQHLHSILLEGCGLG